MENTGQDESLIESKKKIDREMIRTRKDVRKF